MGEWSEELHPRDELGKFTDGGGAREGVAPARAHERVPELRQSGRLDGLAGWASKNRE